MWNRCTYIQTVQNHINHGLTPSQNHGRTCLYRPSTHHHCISTKISHNRHQRITLHNLSLLLVRQVTSQGSNNRDHRQHQRKGASSRGQHHYHMSTSGVFKSKIKIGACTSKHPILDATAVPKINNLGLAGPVLLPLNLNTPSLHINQNLT